MRLTILAALVSVVERKAPTRDAPEFVEGLAACAPSGSANIEETRQRRAKGAKRANPIVRTPAMGRDCSDLRPGNLPRKRYKGANRSRSSCPGSGSSSSGHNLRMDGEFGGSVPRKNGWHPAKEPPG